MPTARDQSPVPAVRDSDCLGRSLSLSYFFLSLPSTHPAFRHHGDACAATPSADAVRRCSNSFLLSCDSTQFLAGITGFFPSRVGRRRSGRKLHDVDVVASRRRQSAALDEFQGGSRSTSADFRGRTETRGILFILDFCQPDLKL